MFKSALFWDSQDIFSVFIATQFYTGSLKSVVFNVGEIAPQATVLCIVGVILWFTTFGWRFQFPGERFLQFKHIKFQKNNICYFEIIAVDALSTPCLAIKVIKRIRVVT